MVIEVSENEMLDRFNDGLKRAASCAGQFTKVEESQKPVIFIDFIDGIKIAAGSAHQLCHSQQNPNWLNIRDFLEGVIEQSQKIVYLPGIFNTPVWSQIKQSLETMSVKGMTMGMARSMPRQAVLEALVLREKNLKDL